MCVCVRVCVWEIRGRGIEGKSLFEKNFKIYETHTDTHKVNKKWDSIYLLRVLVLSTNRREHRVSWPEWIRSVFSTSTPVFFRFLEKSKGFYFSHLVFCLSKTWDNPGFRERKNNVFFDKNIRVFDNPFTWIIPEKKTGTNIKHWIKTHTHIYSLPHQFTIHTPPATIKNWCGVSGRKGYTSGCAVQKKTQILNPRIVRT